MYQMWFLFAAVEIFATASLGQYIGNPYLDSTIDKAWQRHGGGFLNKESYAHDSSKERKISTTIGTFGSPLMKNSGLSPYLQDRYDIREPPSIYIPEVALADDTERFIEVQHEPLRAIEGPLPVHINKYGQNYERGALIAVTKDDDKLLYKEYSERLPLDAIYKEHPAEKDRVRVITRVHPSEKEDYVVEKFRKDLPEKYHFTVKTQHPKEEHIMVDTFYNDRPRSGHIELNTHKAIYNDKSQEDFNGKDHLIVKTQETVFKDRPVDTLFIDRIHKDVPGRDKVILSPQDKFYREEIVPREEFILDKGYRDSYGRDSIALTSIETPYKDMYVSPALLGSQRQVSVKTEEVYEPKSSHRGKDRVTVKTEEKIYKDIPKSGRDTIIIPDAHRRHSELYEEPFLNYEDYLDEKFGFENYDEEKLYRVQEKNLKVNVPPERSLTAFRTRPAHRNTWPKKEMPCDELGEYLGSTEC